MDPLFSVAYRFLIASAILMLYCVLFKLKMHFSLYEHFFLFLQGIFLFGLNYWMVYMAEEHLTSGLVAVVFSSLIFLNIFFNAVILKAPVRREVIYGAAMGFSGMVLIFHKEITLFSLSDSNFTSFLLALTSVVLASLGNILSAFNQKRKVPVVQANAYGMLYGSLVVMGIGLFSGSSMQFDPRFDYLASLLYLSVFGSIIAFGSYLKFLGEVGPDRAGYVSFVMPVIALLFSTVFEGYTWRISAILGIVLILAGNLIILRRKLRNQTARNMVS